jgi:hypothetical protein
MKTRLVLLLTLLGLIHGVRSQTLSQYQAAVNAQSPSYYFTFDGGSLANSLGGTPILNALVAGSTVNPYPQFIYDIFQNPSNCLYFSVQGDGVYDSTHHLISGGGSLGTSTSTASGTITLLFRTPDPGPPSGSTTGPGQKFVFSAGGADATSNALALFIENPNGTNNPNALKLDFGDVATTIVPATNLVWDTWYYFALTYNESSTNANGLNTNKATWYLGRLNGAGTLASGQTVNNTNAIAGDGTDFFIGEQTTGKSGLEKPGDGRVDEFAIWNNVQLTAAQIGSQFTNLPNPAIPAVSAYQTVISNQTPTHYFQLAGNAVDSINPSSVALTVASGTILVTNTPFNTSVGFSDDYFLDQNGAAYFSLAADAIYTNVNLLNGGGTYNGNPGSGKGSISGMFHALPCTNFYGGQKFIVSAGGSTATTNAFALYLENPTNANPWSLKFRFGDSTDVLVSGTNILSEWYYFAVTYDETAINQQVQWWIGKPGGTLQSGFFSASIGSLAGAGNAFYIGNDVTAASGFRYQNSSHTGNGQVSQIAVWDGVLLTTNQVAAQFNALSVSAPVGPPPVLSIAVAGTNAIISWPASTNPGYGLQSATNLASPVWLGAGTASVVGTNNVVTNSISGKVQFYRLSK